MSFGRIALLFLLTEDIQIGKTRWLERLVVELDGFDAPCFGVIAPGDWVRSSGEHANDQGFEKLGIYNLLLPSKVAIRFADRIDIAKEKGTFDAESEAGKVELGWHIYDDALDKVNEHLSTVPKLCKANDDRTGLLIIDELGRLELDHDGGLVEAIRLLEAGPQGCITDALIVVRETLVQKVEARFAFIWGGSMRIAPTQEAVAEIEEHILSN